MIEIDVNINDDQLNDWQPTEQQLTDLQKLANDLKNVNKIDWASISHDLRGLRTKFENTKENIAPYFRFSGDVLPLTQSEFHDWLVEKYPELRETPITAMQFTRQQFVEFSEYVKQQLEQARPRANSSEIAAKTTEQKEQPNPYPELFKKGGFGLFTYLFDNISQFKPPTRASVLFHGVRNECFTDTATHSLYIDFLTKHYGKTPSKIIPLAPKGEDFIKHTLPQMVENYNRQKKEVVEK